MNDIDHVYAIHCQHPTPNEPPTCTFNRRKGLGQGNTLPDKTRQIHHEIKVENAIIKYGPESGDGVYMVAARGYGEGDCGQDPFSGEYLCIFRRDD